MTSKIYCIKFNKKIFLSGIFSFCILWGFNNSAYADSNNSVYLGLTSGYGSAGWDSLAQSGISTTKGDAGLAIGALIGYDFNKNFAVEADYTNFHKSSFYLMDDGRQQLAFSIRTQTGALLGKFSIPLADRVSIYTKFGPDYMSSALQGSDNSINSSVFAIAYGAGIEYGFSPNIFAGISWTRYVGNPKLNANNGRDYQPDANLYGFNISYKFNNNNSKTSSQNTAFDNTDGNKTNGFYVGLIGGFGITGWYAMDGTVHSNLCQQNYHLKVSGDDGFAAGLLMGYDFNRYFALQTEYMNFFNKVSLVGDGIVGNGLQIQPNPQLWTIKTQVIGLTGKLKIPVTEQIDIYTKLGIDCLFSDFDTTFFVSNKPYTSYTFSPLYGFGIENNITRHMSLGLSWARYNGEQKMGTQSPDRRLGNYQPTADLFALNITYKFGK